MTSPQAGTIAGQRVLVTGASGFIGGALARRLAGTGAYVYLVSRSASRIEDGGAAGGARWLQADLASAEAVDELVRTVRPDIVFHLASHVAGSRDLALVPATLRGNLVSTVNLMTSLAEVGCGSVVLAGSMEEPMDDAGTPGSPYAASKWASSGYARMFFALYDLPVVTARIFMTYGPAQPDRRKLIPYVTDCLLRGEPPQLTGGERLVDWVYVDDVVDGLLAMALEPRAAGQTVDLGSGRLVSIRHIVERLGRLANPEVAPHFGALPDRPMEHSRVADVNASCDLIGWRPRTPLEQGLARTVEWYREHPPSPH